MAIFGSCEFIRARKPLNSVMCLISASGSYRPNGVGGFEANVNRYKS